MRKIRVCVIDDQHVVREGLVALLSFQSDIIVVGQAENGIDGLTLVQQTKPDVVLLDLVMPRQDGVTTILKMRDLNLDARILVLSSFADGDLVFNAIKAGALGYMLKDATSGQLLQAIHDVDSGRASLHPSIALKVIRELNTSPEDSARLNSLTRRERETLELIARGLSNQEIADRLVVSERTVAKYVSSILAKLSLTNRTQAALYLLENDGSSRKRGDES